MPIRTSDLLSRVDAPQLACGVASVETKWAPLYMLPEGETMTAKRYKWVLQRLFIPFYERMYRKYGKDVVMQEDNAPWHTAKIIKKYLDNKRVRRMI